VVAYYLGIDAIGVDTAEASIDSCKAPQAGPPRPALLGHAEAIGADVVLTTDRRWKRVSDRVHVV